MEAASKPQKLYDLRTSGDCLFFEKDGRKISPWHDIPLFSDDQKETLNMVVEIPRGSNAKMEGRTTLQSSLTCLANPKF